MALTSNVPPIVFTPTGVVIPSESVILTAVQDDINQAFGGGLNPALETPQGQLASSETAIISDKNNEFVFFVNQINPDFSSGNFQDAIARIYFLNRKPATSTAVEVVLGGLVGTTIPVGTLAQDTNGNTYSCSGTVTIDVSGSVAATFANIVTGPIPCAANTLTQVYQAIPGWDTINNPSTGVMGENVEGRDEFEFRRFNSVALNAHGTLNSIYATVFNLDNVLDVYATENTTSAIVNTGPTSYPLAPHSLYVAVVGGLDADIAQAIWSKKDVGCDYNGNTTVVVTDQSGYSYPYPSYNVKFERPTSLPISFDVQIVNNPSLPSNIITLTEDAILARFIQSRSMMVAVRQISSMLVSINHLHWLAPISM